MFIIDAIKVLVNKNPTIIKVIGINSSVGSFMNAFLRSGSSDTENNIIIHLYIIENLKLPFSVNPAVTNAQIIAYVIRRINDNINIWYDWCGFHFTPIVSLKPFNVMFNRLTPTIPNHWYKHTVSVKPQSKKIICNTWLQTPLKCVVVLPRKEN